jgi:hypothetical protein
MFRRFASFVKRRRRWAVASSCAASIVIYVASFFCTLHHMHIVLPPILNKGEIVLPSVTVLYFSSSIRTNKWLFTIYWPIRTVTFMSVDVFEPPFDVFNDRYIVYVRDLSGLITD